MQIAERQYVHQIRVCTFTPLMTYLLHHRYLNFHQILCYIFLNQDGLEHRKSYLRQAVPQTMLTCIVINTPNLVGYTWVECSIRDDPGQTIRDLETDHTCTAHCQNYLWLPRVEGPPTFGINGLSKRVFFSDFCHVYLPLDP